MKIRLRHILRERDMRGCVNEQVLSIYRDLGVVPKSGRTDNFNKTPEDLTNYKLVIPGDVVVNKMKAWQGSIAVSPYRGIVSGDYLVCEVQLAIAPRYLHHMLRSRPMIAEYEIRSTGIRPSQWRLYWDDFGDIAVDIPGERDQRAISEFLDGETARINALIARKRALSRLLLEKERCGIDRIAVPVALGGVADAPSTERWPVTSLKRIATFFTDGDWIESPFITASGIRLIQTGNVQRGEYREQGFRYISEETFRSLRCTEVFPGDILISRLAGPVGCACMAPDLGVRMVASVDVVILRPSDVVLSEFVVAYLSSGRHLALAELEARGTTIQRLSRSQVGEMQVPLPRLSVQRAVVERVREIREKTIRLHAPLERQVAILQERRQALITAAVLGELDIPGAAA